MFLKRRILQKCKKLLKSNLGNYSNHSISIQRYNVDRKLNYRKNGVIEISLQDRTTELRSYYVVFEADGNRITHYHSSKYLPVELFIPNWEKYVLSLEV